MIAVAAVAEAAGGRRSVAPLGTPIDPGIAPCHVAAAMPWARNPLASEDRDS